MNSDRVGDPDVDSSLGVHSRAVRGGWMLRGLLIPESSILQCRLALRMAYQSIRWTDAGLAMAPESNDLLLMQWHGRLPGAELMHRQTEQFRDGLEVWRESLVRLQASNQMPVQSDRLSRTDREHRIRQQILGHQD